MLGRLLYAIAAFIVVFLACQLLGLVLADLKVEILATIGTFLRTWAVLLGVAAGLLAFVSGRAVPGI